MATNNSADIATGAIGTVLTGNGVGVAPTFQIATANTSFVGGRLSLVSGVPVTTTDQLAATTLYYVPYLGENMDLYSGSAWVNFQLTQLSIAIPATTNHNYDAFMQYNAGTPQLSLTAWTNQTTRSTSLAYQNGVLVLSGTPTSRYLGTIATTGVSGQTEDSVANRFVWNYYNRATRKMLVTESTADWLLPASSSWRQANANAANQLNFVCGVVEDVVNATISVTAYSAGGNALATVGVDLDSTSVVSTTCINAYGSIPNNAAQQITAFYSGYTGIGVHYLAWLENSANGSTTHMSAASAISTGNPYCGISGVILG